MDTVTKFGKRSTLNLIYLCFILVDLQDSVNTGINEAKVGQNDKNPFLSIIPTDAKPHVLSIFDFENGIRPPQSPFLGHTAHH